MSKETVPWDWDWSIWGAKTVEDAIPILLFITVIIVMRNLYFHHRQLGKKCMGEVRRPLVNCCCRYYWSFFLWGYFSVEFAHDVEVQGPRWGIMQETIQYYIQHQYCTLTSTIKSTIKKPSVDFPFVLSVLEFAIWPFQIQHWPRPRIWLMSNGTYNCYRNKHVVIFSGSKIRFPRVQQPTSTPTPKRKN